jgi:Domain of unknown function (DUF4124)
MTVLTLASAIYATSINAQTLYRYTDERGRIVYSDKPLTHLAGRPYDEINRNGATVKRAAVAPTNEELTAKATEQRRRMEIDKAQEAENRRNAALLVAYSNEREIDEAHQFALREPVSILRQTEAKLAAAEKRSAGLRAQVESLGVKPVPTEQREALVSAELEVKSLSQIRETKRRDVQAVNERYEEDKRRFVEYMRQRGGAPIAANAPTGVVPPASR